MQASLAQASWCASDTSETIVPDTKAHAKSPAGTPGEAGFVPSTIYSVHEFEVPLDAGDAQWPESHERERVWVPYEEAYARVGWRRGMRAVLDQTAIGASARRDASTPARSGQVEKS